MSLPFRAPILASVLASVLALIVAGLLIWSLDPQEVRRDARDPTGGQAAGNSGTILSRSSADTPSGTAPNSPLWRPVDENSVRKLPDYAPAWSKEGRALVAVAGAAAAARDWQVGRRLTFSVPQLGETYQPLIEEIEEGPGLARSAVGKLSSDGGRTGRFVVTVGTQHMFAYLDTPQGVFELIADTHSGWLIPRASLMANVDFSQPDYIVPRNERKQRPSHSERRLRHR